MFVMDAIDESMFAAGIGTDLNSIKERWDQKVKEILDLAKLDKPAGEWMQSGGKQGDHTEYLGFILAEMQHLPRMHPDANW
jgi:ring-1,2-phenylacetyl-CoA epoxidase subunit PaaC